MCFDNTLIIAAGPPHLGWPSLDVGKDVTVVVLLAFVHSKTVKAQSCSREHGSVETVVGEHWETTNRSSIGVYKKILFPSKKKKSLRHSTAHKPFGDHLVSSC